MGKKVSNRKATNGTPGSHASITLRQESTGKKQTNANPKSILKVQHIKNLAAWASGEASIHSLGAFFGHHLAASADALGTPHDTSLFSCQRCESILQPGYNCTIRIEKSKSKARHRRKKPSISTQNNVVFKCHFCSHQNLKRGTPRGHMKEICPRKAKAPSKPEPAKNTVQQCARSGRGTIGNVEAHKMDEVAIADIANDVEVHKMDKVLLPIIEKDVEVHKMDEVALPDIAKDVEPHKMDVVVLSVIDKDVEVHKMDEVALPDIAKDDPETNSPATPLVRMGTSLLEGRRRKRNRSGSKKAVESESSSAMGDAENTVSASNKRKRKSWTSLKEIAESSEHDNSQNFANLTIPFLI